MTGTSTGRWSPVSKPISVKRKRPLPSRSARCARSLVTWLRIAEFVAFCCTFNVVVTWVFNKTGQSLPLIMLLHVSVNNYMSVVYGEMFPSINTAAQASHVTLLAGTTAALVVLVATRGRLGYRPDRESEAALRS